MLIVPWMDPKDLEIEAEKVLKNYGDQVKPIVVPPVPIEHILEGFLGLDLELDDLNQGDVERDTLGALYVEDRKVVVDSKLEEQEGRYNFTVAHEVGHWVLHKDIYLKGRNQLSLLEEEKKPSIICRKSEEKKPQEWQTNYFAGALLVPKRILMDVLQEENRKETAWVYDQRVKKLWGLEKESYYHSVASFYNKRFGVSVQAMQIRLEQLGLLREEVNTRLF